VLNSFGFTYQRPDLHILLFSLPVIILVAWCMVVCIERPIERVRSKVRPVTIK
jgi:hypothetical protein